MININDNLLDNLNNDSKNLIKIAQGCDSNGIINKLISNLENAISAKFDANKPLIVTLVGGTGSGKSELFCKLIEKEGASPSSKEGQRNYTDRCYIYAPQEYIGNLLPEDWGDATYIESEKNGFVLVDTPDLDGTREENIEQAKAMAEISDILVFVTTPEKYSNAVLHKALKRWTTTKNWYFVLNKIDTLKEESRKNIKSQFIKRIKELGFLKPEEKSFFVSATTDENIEDFNRLKDELISEKSSVSNKLFHYRAKLIKYKNAVSKNIEIAGNNMLVKDYFEKLKNELISEENKAKTSNESEIRNIISESDSKYSIQKTLTYELYDSMCGKSISFVSPFLWVNKYFHRVKENQTKKELEYKINSSEQLKSNYRSILNFMHQNNLISWDYYKNSILKPDFQLSDLCIKEKAEKIASSFKSNFLLFFANLLPLALVLYVLYLAIHNLLQGTSLTNDYFVQAGIILLMLSWFGAYLICKYINRQEATSLSLDLANNVIANQDGFAILREKKAQLEEIIRLINEIDKNTSRQIKEIEPKIRSGYGISAN